MQREIQGGRKAAAVQRRRRRVEQPSPGRGGAVEDDDIVMAILRDPAEEGEDALDGPRARGEAADVGALQSGDERVEIEQPAVLTGAEVVLIDRPQRRAGAGDA